MNTAAMIRSAGYIVTDNEAIWGYGETADAAWARMLSEMKMAGIRVLEDGEEADHESETVTKAENFTIRPASEALLAEVECCGGAIAWRSIAGVACTRAEEDEASTA